MPYRPTTSSRGATLAVVAAAALTLAAALVLGACVRKLESTPRASDGGSRDAAPAGDGPTTGDDAPNAANDGSTITPADGPTTTPADGPVATSDQGVVPKPDAKLPDCGARHQRCCAAPLKPCAPGLACTEGFCSCLRTLAASKEGGCATFISGALQCWGDNTFGQVKPALGGAVAVPTTIALGVKAAQVYSGPDANHNCVITTTGLVYCWGDNQWGQLGRAGTGGTPQAIVGLGDVSHLAVGAAHSCALSLKKIYCWGSNSDGQLAMSTATKSLTKPTLVASMSSAAVVDVAAGSAHTCGLKLTGDLYCWGRGIEGQLGQGGNNSADGPQAVKNLPSAPKHVVAGAAHTCVLATDRTIRCWGANDKGQLGDSTRTSRPLAQLVKGGPGSYVHVAAGSHHNCAIGPKGGVFCWGANDHGQCGNGKKTTAEPTPIKVTLPGPARVLALGQRHSCALLADGSVYCWGHDDRAQTASGSTAGLVPVPARAKLACP